jgi:preprotein translocase subunit SecD
VTKSLTWRGILYAVLILVALFLLIPSVSTDLPPWWPKYFAEKKVNLGLDLQGGVHLILDVKVERAVENEIVQAEDDLLNQLRKKRIRYHELASEGTTGINVTLMRKEDEADFKNLIEKNYPQFELQSGSMKENGIAFQLVLRDRVKKEIQDRAFEQVLDTIRDKRVDDLGVREADIRRQKNTQILIQLPGVKDPQKAIDQLGQRGLLEFKLVDEENMTNGNWQNEVPPGDEILYETELNDKGERTKRPWLLKRRAVLTGQYLKDASPHISSQTNKMSVSLSFEAQGARKFEQITEENQGKRLAIVLDDVVYSAPNIQEKIAGGNALITGSFTDEEATRLARVLKTPLSAPVEIMEKRLVGPSLGKDSIEKGMRAGWIAVLIVVIFMLIYYRFSGIFANVAMTLNILFILSVMALAGATLTLPGIAGIVLTIGMAVDANVLIFERIREELRFGKTALAASQAGFDKATITIFDANLTTLITAIVLYQFGTGPVKGFAVTLAIGLVANFVTAVYMTKIIYDYLYGYLRWQKISI